MTPARHVQMPQASRVASTVFTSQKYRCACFFFWRRRMRLRIAGEISSASSIFFWLNFDFSFDAADLAAIVALSVFPDEALVLLRVLSRAFSTDTFAFLISSL